MTSRSISVTTACRLVALAAWACTSVGTARAQTAFTDDAGRSVVLPAKVERVFAAGAPAEVLLYGTIDDDYVAALEAISDRAKIPGNILDGSLEKIPAVYRRRSPTRR